MHRLLFFILPFTFFSCNSKQTSKVAIQTQETRKDSISPNPIQTVSFQNNDTPSKDTIISDDEYQTCFVVIADTGYQYTPLRDQMLALHHTLNQPIDTLGRSYLVAKDLIALPENDEDELYAGDYYPRRGTTPDLSLEYLSFYKLDAPEKNIALVTGIYENQNSADSALNILKKVNINAFWVKSKIYMGCIH